MSSPNGILSRSKSNGRDGVGGAVGVESPRKFLHDGMKFNKGECTQHRKAKRYKNRPAWLRKAQAGPCSPADTDDQLIGSACAHTEAVVLE